MNSTGSRIIGIVLVFFSAFVAAVALSFASGLRQRISTTALSLALLIIGYGMAVTKGQLPIALIIVAALCAGTAFFLGIWSAITFLN
jgi:hypothetical protein